MKMHQAIDDVVSNAIQDCDPNAIVDAPFTQVKTEYRVKTVASTRPGYDRQFNEIMRIAKRLNVDPKEFAEKVATYLREYLIFEKVDVSGNGFINFKLSEKCILTYAHAWWPVHSETPRKIVIDFGGPNIAKALHVGHLRSLVIGESLRRILELRGHTVISDIHLGDWGLPMGMLISELINRDSSLMNPSFYSIHEQIINDLVERISCFDLEQMYPEVAAACKTNPVRMGVAREIIATIQAKQNSDDPDAWFDVESQYQYKCIWEAIRQISLEKIIPTIERLDVHFDLMKGESSVAELMGEVFECIEEHARIDDGATVIDVANPDDKEPMPPLMYKKSDDGYTYAATDLATIWDRITSVDSPNQIIYVVDNRQSLHFKQVFRVAQWLAPNVEFVHAGFGTVNGKDKKPFKTRDGGVPTLDWMLDTVVAKSKERTIDPMDAHIIGTGAIKYADLITNRESGYIFDIDRITALEGKTGPYIQYAAVRIQHILDKVDTSPGRDMVDPVITCPEERELLLTCANYPETLEIADRLLLPSYVAEYAYNLAQRFSAFYAACPVIEDGVVNKSRVEICLTVQGILKSSMFLLGLYVPKKM